MFKHCIIICLLSVLAVVCFTGRIAPGLTADQAETWSGGSVAGWQRQDTLSGSAVSLKTGDGALALEFRAQSMPLPVVDMVYADVGASGGRFTGNYATSGVTSARFKLYCPELLPDQARLYFSGAAGGNRWYYPLSGLKTGEWVTFEAPLVYGIGWRIGTDPLREKFENDLKAVAWIGLRLQRNGSTDAQTYRLDDFTLTGPEAATSNGVPYVWVKEHFSTETGAGGGGGAAWLAEQDADSDGMNNYAEYLAGTDPNNGDSRFKLGMVPDEKTIEEDVQEIVGIALRWNSTTNRRYTVFRASNLVEGFRPIQSAIPATPPVNTYVDVTATDSGPYFYRIEVELGE